MSKIYSTLLLVLVVWSASAQNQWVTAELQNINQALKSPTGIRLLEGLDSIQQQVQRIAVNDSLARAFVLDPVLKQKTRCEVFTISAIRESDLTPQSRDLCKDGGCYWVEIYNYVRNEMLTLAVNRKQKQVLGYRVLKNMQPEIPVRLKDLAVRLAVESEEVQQALGFKPSEAQALMASTKTALNRSRCERSLHLCVAPTFVKGEKALWAIVDLTDLKVVGVRWTRVGSAGPVPTEILTERKVQNGNITDCYCKTETVLERNGWSLNYMLTSSDGMRISNVKYGGQPVLESAKLVDWHVSYSNTDGFGYSDGVGCPYFSSSAVIAIEPPKVVPIVEGADTTGFALQQNFASEGWPSACNYNYCQRFEFYKDGAFRITTASLGRGCGNDGTYRPVFRIVFAGEQQRFSEWQKSAWMPWEQEKWQLQTPLTTYTKEGYQYKLETAEAQGYYIEPSVGQFADGGRGDNAYMFVTKRQPKLDEGDTDLPTIGPCCNTNYEQGPEKFMSPPDQLGGSGLVLWYVPQMKNDDRKGFEYCWVETVLENGVYSHKVYPCFAGPKFVPFK